MPHVAFVIALMAFWPSAAAAGVLRVDLDRDGIRDEVRPALKRPGGLDLWLSSTRRVLHLNLKHALGHIVASDVDRDGWLDIVASDASPRSAGIHVWKNTGSRGFERVRKRVRTREQMRRHTGDGQIDDGPPHPPATPPGATSVGLGLPDESAILSVSPSPSGTVAPRHSRLSSRGCARPRRPRGPPRSA